MVAAQETVASAVKGKVLVVDDEAVIRNMVAQALGRRGFECHTAGDGDEANELIEAEKYDVVITDLKMPHRHGHALCVDLLERPARPLIVVITGVSEPRLTKDLKTRGVEEIYSKPLDHPRLAARLEELIADRNGRPSPGDSHAAPVAASEPSPPPDADAEESAKPSESEAPAACATAAADDGVQTKHMAVVLMRSPEQSQELADKLASSTMEVAVARNSEELHEQINRQRIDLLVVEHEQKGFLTGIEILERLRDQLVRPEAILIADADDRLQEQADGLGIDRIIAPGTDFDDLAESAQLLLAAQKTVDVFIAPQARKIVQLYGDIPPMPQLLIRLAAYMEMETDEIPLDDLAQEISVDQKATTELLKLANSAALGVREKVTGVSDAVKLLGPQQAILLILASATVRIQSDLLSEWSHPLRQWFQKRSILIASTASTCGGRLEGVSADTAFVMGLLQDMGILILAKRFGTRYRRVLQRLQRVGRTQLPLVETQDFRMTHAEVSAALMQRWDLPKSLVRPVLCHHKSVNELDGSNTEVSFHRVMQIGEALANLVDLPHPTRQEVLNELLGHYGSQKAAECRTALQDSVTKASQLAEVFSVPPPDQQTLETLAAKWPYLQ